MGIVDIILYAALALIIFLQGSAMTSLAERVSILEEDLENISNELDVVYDHVFDSDEG